jgi:hypothetical protein
MKPDLLESADEGEADFFRVFCQMDCPHTSSIIGLRVMGPGKENDAFTLPRSHYRGFSVIKVCTTCKQQIQQGQPVTVIYKGHQVSVNQAKHDVRTKSDTDHSEPSRPS